MIKDKWSSVLSSISGAVGTKLIDKLCDCMEVSMQDIEQVYHKKTGSYQRSIHFCFSFISETLPYSPPSKLFLHDEMNLIRLIFNESTTFA